MFLLIAQGISIGALCCLFWRCLRRFFIATDLDNIPGPVSQSFVKGNFGQLFNATAWAFHDELAAQYGRVVRIFGSFESQNLYVFDSKALHNILVKDQHIFEETSGFLAANKISFGDGLLATHGERHRRQRKMMNPVFSTVHMRHMVPMFTDVAKKLEQVIKLKITSGAQEIDILHWMTRAALEMIGQSGLGYSFDPLVEGTEPHFFSKSIKDYIPVSSTMLFHREYLLPTLVNIGTPRFRRFVVNIFPWKTLQRMRDIVDNMDQTVTYIFEEKKRALVEGGDEALKAKVGEGKDIISILMKANMAAKAEDRLPDDEVLGQMSTFAFAGTDTTSNALARTLYLLSIHPKAQNMLRDEIIGAQKRGDGDLNYDELTALPFLDAVCRETLRLYPPVPTTLRRASQDVVLPLSTPIKGRDGREMHSIVVPRGTKVVVSIVNANQDPTLWGPDAHEWKPERWHSPLPKALHDAHMPGVYSHLMTFIGGSRSCIGFKFAELEMKVILASLISNFRFSLSDEDIVWEMNFIVTPCLKGLSRQPQLPLKVELAEPSTVSP